MSEKTKKFDEIPDYEWAANEWVEIVSFNGNSEFVCVREIYDPDEIVRRYEAWHIAKKVKERNER